MLDAIRTVVVAAMIPGGYGVMIVAHSLIAGPQGTRKEVDRFIHGPGSYIGDIVNHQPRFRNNPTSLSPRRFNITGLSPNGALPQTRYFPRQRDFPTDQIEQAVKAGARAIVLGTYHGGYWPKESVKEMLPLIKKHRVLVILADPTPAGYVQESKFGFGVPAGDWDPFQLLSYLRYVLLFTNNKEDICMAIWSGVATAVIAIEPTTE
ncbi:l- type ii [Fusarium albosuccineum]|uniref:L- type ii n=1 Tax=Fusarium albosuccineum TaxID=1237068 RepID=A0A8H4L9D8_9HYPO|nr:l- type ii [Fusarium albosuccineum]